MKRVVYRDAIDKPRNIEVVRYRPVSTGMMLFLCALTGFLSLLMLGFALSNLRATSITCVHGSVHTCTVERAYGPITTHEAVPILDISRVQVTTHKNKNSVSYGVSIFTRNGDDIVLARPGNQADARAIAAAVERTVDNSATDERKLDVQGAAPFSALFFTIVGLGFGLVPLTITRSARLAFDFDRKTIDFTRTRWPLRSVHRRLSPSDVQRAQMHAKPGSRGGTIYSVALVIRGEPDLDLVPGGSSGENHHSAAAEKINALLLRMREDTT